MVLLAAGCNAPPTAPAPTSRPLPAPSIAPSATATPLPAPTPTALPPTPCPALDAQSKALGANQPAELVLEQPAQTVPRLCKLELRLDLGFEINNPYDPNAADVQVDFTPPSGAAMRVPAFYLFDPANAQNTGWRVRFTPTVEGNWQAVATAITLQGTHTSNAVRFDVSPRNAPGFVRAHPTNPRYLAFDDGRTFFPIGVNLGWWRNDAIAEYTRWLDALHANGATTARIWMASWSFGIEWKDTPLGDYKNRAPRMLWLDRVIELAEQRGIYLVIGLIPDRDFRADGTWADNPYNKANAGMLDSPIDFVSDPQAQAFFQRRLRYIAARWGYSPNILTWEYWNEVESTRIETPALMPWITAMTRTLRQFDINRHLITTSYVGNGDDNVWRMPEIDLLQRHEYSETPKWFQQIPGGFRLTPNTPIKPLIFGEFGFSSRGETVTPATRDGIHLHNALWASTFNGFATAVMYWWWDDYIDAGNLWPRFRGLAAFLADEDLAALTPITATTTPQATAMSLMNAEHGLLWLRNNAWNQSDASFRYSISQSTGEPFVFAPKALTGVRVELAGVTGAWLVEWRDTDTGQPISTTQATANNGRLTLVAPAFATDICAKLRRLPTP